MYMCIYISICISLFLSPSLSPLLLLQALESPTALQLSQGMRPAPPVESRSGTPEARNAQSPAPWQIEGKPGKASNQAIKPGFECASFSVELCDRPLSPATVHEISTQQNIPAPGPVTPVLEHFTH